MMLTQIHIRDLATIEELHLQFDIPTATTMITGETGAGKSIFIEAIELALGGRGSPNSIRPGKDRTDISLCFENNSVSVIDWLNGQDLYQENNNECIIRRVITSDGRSRSYINGFPSTLPLVRELAEHLFHLHGQHAQQILLNANTQCDILDRYADHLPLCQLVKSLSQEWKQYEKEIKTREEKNSERSERTALLQFQLDEFYKLAIKENEWESLEAKHRQLSHKDDLMRTIHFVLNNLANNEDRNVLSNLNEMRKKFEMLQSLDSKATEWIQNLQAAQIELNDLEDNLRTYLEKIELDSDHLQKIEERISELHALSRKHKIPPSDLFSFQKHLIHELDSLNSNDATLAKLKAEKKNIEANYKINAEKLSKSRKAAAEKLSKTITTTIRSLSLPHGEFQITFEPDLSAFSNHGNERPIFLIKTNPDQSLQPLAKVISGGELSRLSLAVHLAVANRSSIPTLIFDEVDTGVSGAAAEKIGKLLKKLGETYQVFCITHQPQVAGYGHHHLLVEKYFQEKTTYTRLRFLDLAEKTKEIARMLGGETITQATLRHAMEIVGCPEVSDEIE